MSAIGTKQTSLFAPHMSAIGVIADIDEPAPQGGHQENTCDQHRDRRLAFALEAAMFAFLLK
jgi:hypothetical protein